MVHKLLIDEQALGWGNDNESVLKERYEKIFKVGTPPAPKSGTKDDEIGEFCEEENCNLITGDYTAYLHFLENPRIKSIQIEKYGKEAKGNRQIYLIRIL